MNWWIILVVAAGVGIALGISGWLLLRQGRVAESAREAQDDVQTATHRRPPLRSHDRTSATR
jgi:hypothetical protein